MKKLLYILIGLGLSIAGIAHAINVTVPQSPAAGAVLFGNANGTYNSSTTPLFVDKTNGRLGIGNTSPAQILTIGTPVGAYGGAGTAQEMINGGNNTTLQGGQLRIFTTDSAGTDLGGSLALGGNYSGTANSIDFASIAGRLTTGTTDGGYLQLSTRDDTGNMTEKARISSTGNFGIGNTAPNSKLEVSGAIRITGDSDPSVNQEALHIGWTSGNVGYFRCLNTLVAWRKCTIDGDPVVFNTLGGGGKVGIGVDPPQSKLHVKNDGGSATAFTGDQLRIDSGVSGHNASLHFTDAVTSDAGISFVPSATPSSRKLSLSGDYSTENLIIRGDGNVGVGATTPDAKFFVTITDGAGMRVDYNGTGDNYLDGGNTYFRNLNGVSNIMNLIGSTKFVGIGTVTPASLLHVYGANAVLTVGDSSSGGGTIRLGLADASRGQWSYDGSANTYFDFAQVLRVRSITGGTSERLTVLSNGNVGIGSATPGSLLTVMGAAGGTIPIFTVASSSGTTGLNILANGAYYSMAISSTTISTIAYTVDLSQSNVQSFVLSTSTTLTINNIKAGLRGILNLQQDATGSRTVTWPSSFHWPASTAPTLTTTASKVDVVSYECYSVNVCFAGSNLNYAP